MAVSHTYEDRFGEIVDRPDEGYLELRWYDTTAEMSGAQFQNWLTQFAAEVERLRRPGVLVDSTSFRMDPANMDAAWRDANIIPRYNTAGVKRFAFHMPAGMPAIGSPPQSEPPGAFPTGYFGSREQALGWLASTP
jgi:hypothetical protein